MDLMELRVFLFDSCWQTAESRVLYSLRSYILGDVRKRKGCDMGGRLLLLFQAASGSWGAKSRARKEGGGRRKESEGGFGREGASTDHQGHRTQLIGRRAARTHTLTHSPSHPHLN